MPRRRLLVFGAALATLLGASTASADLSPSGAVLADLIEVAIDRDTPTHGVDRSVVEAHLDARSGFTVEDLAGGHFTRATGLSPVGARLLAELRTAPFHGLEASAFVTPALTEAIDRLDAAVIARPPALRDMAGRDWMSTLARSLPDSPAAADPAKVAIAARLASAEDLRVRAWFDARQMTDGERAAARAHVEVELARALVAWSDAMDPTRGALDPALRSSDVDAVDAALVALAPVDPDYAALVRELARLRAVANGGGWPSHPTDPAAASTLEGQAAVRARLVADGWFEGPVPAIEDDRHGGAAPIDAGLSDAIARFQAHHQLAPTGLLDRDTLDAMAVPAADRADTIARNLERLRSARSRHDAGADAVLVNVAAYEVRVVLDGSEAMRMRAVVGATTENGRNRTPLFSDAMERIELNPIWYVPPRIARRIYANPARGYEWYGGQLIQRPGPHNSLGRAKFLFPNPHAVYLHDTNHPELFDRPDRAASSGCVRVADPLGLAAVLIAHDTGRSVEDVRAEVDAIIASGRTEAVALTTPLPVHIEYRTAWLSDSGRVAFATDVYGMDAPTS